MAHLLPGASDAGARQPDDAADAFAALHGLRAADGRPLLPSQDGTECTTALLEPTGEIGWAERNYSAVTGVGQPVAGTYWPDSLPYELREAADRMLAELSSTGPVDRILPCFTPTLARSKRKRCECFRTAGRRRLISSTWGTESCPRLPSRMLSGW